MDAIVSASEVEKRYPMADSEVEALRGVDFIVQPGEFVAIMGPSGSGKSSLLHLLGGLDESSGGEVQLAGRKLAELNDDQLTLLRRRQIGFVFQFLNLLPTLSAAENVALPLLLDGMRGSQAAAEAGALLEIVGLSDRANHRPDQLSGGQQQRVALARALVTRPALVLADEPTGNLDRSSGAEMLALMRAACDQRGQTIVIVTHDPLVAAQADRVVFLQDGELVHELALGGVADRVARITASMAELEL